MEYDRVAEDYAETRQAVPWIAEPLALEVKKLPKGAVIVDAGCGTGDYLAVLAKEAPGRVLKGFDSSKKMLDVARKRVKKAELKKADAEKRFPYDDNSCDMVIVVDVLHHLRSVGSFFKEAARVLKSGASLMVVTDSESDVRNRSLSKYIPGVLEIELKRYPSLLTLHRTADRAGLSFLGAERVEGATDIDDDLIAKIEARFCSALRLITDEQLQEGIGKVRRIQERGLKWLSFSTIAKYRRR